MRTKALRWFSIAVLLFFSGCGWLKGVADINSISTKVSGVFQSGTVKSLDTFTDSTEIFKVNHVASEEESLITKDVSSTELPKAHKSRTVVKEAGLKHSSLRTVYRVLDEKGEVIYVF